MRSATVAQTRIARWGAAGSGRPGREVIPTGARDRLALRLAAARPGRVAGSAGMQAEGGELVPDGLRDLTPRLRVCGVTTGDHVLPDGIAVVGEELQVLLARERALGPAVHCQQLAVPGDLAGKGGAGGDGSEQAGCRDGGCQPSPSGGVTIRHLRTSPHRFGLAIGIDTCRGDRSEGTPCLGGPRSCLANRCVAPSSSWTGPVSTTSDENPVTGRNAIADLRIEARPNPGSS